MTGQLRDTVPATGAARRADAGAVHLGRRDIDGLILCAEHYGAPYDLLAVALGTQPARLRGITARWRKAGYAATGRLGPGPAWCWLTPAGMTAAGLGYPASRPALARRAPLRAGRAARRGLAASPAGAPGRPRWHSERRLRAALPGVGVGHRPDAEIHWPSIQASPYAGQVWAVEVWAVEVELTPKPLARTTRIMAGLLGPARYAQVIYHLTNAWLAQKQQRWNDAATELDRARAAFGDKARCGDHTPHLLTRFSRLVWVGPALSKIDAWMQIIERQASGAPTRDQMPERLN